MELKPPRTVRLLFPACIVGLLALIIVPLFLRLAEALGRGEVGPELMMLPMTVVMAWAAWAFALSQAPWRLWADDEGVTLKYRGRTTRILWQQIDTCREESSPLERDGGSWVTLRDSEDRVLLHPERSWFGHSKSSLQEFARFTDFVQRKVAQG